MKTNTKSYPHPVLGNGNDVGGNFSVAFTYKLHREFVTLSTVFNLKNIGVEHLIKSGKAVFVVEVECGATFYRKSFSTQEMEFAFDIPAKSLREKVVVAFFVCTSEVVKGYRPVDPHSDYGGEFFNLDAGDIIALAGYTTFVADKQFDPLRPPVSSFMAIVEGQENESVMGIDYEQDKITIILSGNDWKNYVEFRNQKLIQGMLHSSVVLPVLVEAIHKVQKSSGEYESMNWFGRLVDILETKKLTKLEAFEAAQKILEYPLARAFVGINKIMTTEDEEYE